MPIDDTIASIRTRWEAIAPHFDERLRRLWACAEARSLGRGG
ncbi:MAG TPA: ISAzo13 family transposase, partial [Chloroflexota bacterium]